MNDNQKAVLFIAAGVIVLMLLFPPFSRGYELIFSTSRSIQLGRLIVQLLGVFLTAGVLLCALRGDNNIMNDSQRKILFIVAGIIALTFLFFVASGSKQLGTLIILLLTVCLIARVLFSLKSDSSKNDKIRSLLFSMAGFIAFMLLFPPDKGGNFDFIFSMRFKSVDVGMLFVQWIGICLITGILIYAIQDGRNHNKKQKNVLFGLAGVIAFMLLFPPGRYGYHFIFAGERKEAGFLIAQWIGACLIGGILFYALKDDDSSDNHSENLH